MVTGLAVWGPSGRATNDSGNTCTTTHLMVRGRKKEEYPSYFLLDKNLGEKEVITVLEEYAPSWWGGHGSRQGRARRQES